MTELDRKQERAPVPKEWTYAPPPESRDIVTLEERYGHLVGGDWLEPAETYTTISPATEEALFIMAQSYDKLGLTQLRDDADRVLRTSFPNTQIHTLGLGNKQTPWWRPW